MFIQYRKYSDEIIIALLGIIFILVLILVTDMHVAKINREMRQSLEQPF